MKQFNVQTIRKDFPILQQEVHGHPCVFLDSAASSQKPQMVINAVSDCYSKHYANIHRGVYHFSMEATQRYEAARQTIQHFIHAASPNEIILVRGATEAINLVAHSYGRHFLQQGDEVLISEMEHHSNIVPWQLLRDATGITLKVIPINDKGELIMETFDQLLTERTKLVAVTHISNALGSINPVKEIISKAHDAGAKVLVDGCQATPHIPVDVQDMDCDFYAFSAHKMYGPSGTGALYGKESLLDSMPPYQGGGEMIASVTFDNTTYNQLPHKFEAGTPAIAEVIGFGAAIDYLQTLGLESIASHEHHLLDYATRALSSIDGLTLIGTAHHKAGILSFTLDGIHPHDIGTVLDQHGIAVRAGHHCAQPVMQHFGIAATTRASIGLYNTKDDIDRLVDGLVQTCAFFR